MAGTVARWRSSSAPTSRIRRASRSRAPPMSRRLHPSNEAELAADARAVAPVGAVAGVAGGARAEHLDRSHTTRGEEEARGHAEIDVATAVPLAPRRQGHV